MADSLTIDFESLSEEEQDKYLCLDLPFSELQMIQINHFRSQLTDAEIEAAHPTITDDANIFRFLSGCKFDHDEALELFRGMLEWRKKHGLDEIRSELLEISKKRELEGRQITAEDIPFGEEMQSYACINYHHFEDKVCVTACAACSHLFNILSL